MNVLVIPEDFRKDQFILQPIIAAMLSKLQKPANVEVLRDPLIGGVSQATNREVLSEIVEDNKWNVDLFLLCVDRDAEEGRRSALDRLETHFNRSQNAAKFMAAENAWQELEIWHISDSPAQFSLPIPLALFELGAIKSFNLAFTAGHS